MSIFDPTKLESTRKSGVALQSYPFHRSLFLGEADRPGIGLPLACASCTWWKPRAEDDTTPGECRKHAHDSPPLPLFPLTAPKDYCGDFTRHYTREEWVSVRSKLVEMGRLKVKDEQL